MLQQHRYQRNLLASYRRFMRAFLLTFIPIGILTALIVFVSLFRYQRHSAKAYVFHTGGASIEIYEPTGLQQQAGRQVRATTRQHQRQPQ
jgi:hypothetical protein